MMSRRESRNRRNAERRGVRSYLGAGVASIFVALIVLTIVCFAALTYMTATSKMDISEKSVEYCDNYYAAETLASEILDDAADRQSTDTDESKSYTYESDELSIDVKIAGGDVQYAVPVTSKQDLRVEATIKDGKITIVTWVVE